MSLDLLNPRNWAKKIFSFSLLGALALLQACSELPVEGPAVAEIQAHHENKNTAGFLLIAVGATVADHLKSNTASGFNDNFGKGKPFKNSRIGVGDTLSVHIWEADPAGLFSSGGAVNRGEIPQIVVDNTGKILIPFAGRIRANGRSPSQLGVAIASALRDKTVDPQVHVTITRNVANTVTVTGAVNKPSIIPLTYKGDDLLDVLASVGGAKFPSYESRVSITRNNKIASAYLSHVLQSPDDNIFLRRGDKVNLTRKPQSFSAFGAVTTKGKINFGSAKLSVLEAVGKASGLMDTRADARGVFLMRFEKTSTAYQLADLTTEDEKRSIVPVIYRINLKDPNQYFFAQAIPMHDKDIIFVSNAPSVELDKFMTILGKAVGTGKAITSIAPF